MNRLYKCNKHLIVSAAILLFIFAVIRLVYFVNHHPMLGYANTYDMNRIQSCHGVWPAETGTNPTHPTPSAPHQWYQFDSSIKDSCYYSSYLIFSSISIAIMKLTAAISSSQRVSLKIHGFVQAGIFIAFAGIILYLFIKHENYIAALANSLFFLLIFTDPANTLYLNTFYTELSALFFLYISTAFFILFIITSRMIYLVTLTLCVLGLATSKPQHMLFPLIFLFSYALISTIHKRHSYKAIVVLFLISVTAIIIQNINIHKNPMMTNIRYANNTDTYLFSVLPSTNDPHLSARILGLPPHCVEYAGKSWYSPGMRPHPCPEVRDVARYKILLLALRDPVFLPTMINIGISKLRPWVLNHKGRGHVAEREYAKINNSYFSLSKLIDFLPNSLLTILFYTLPLLVMVILYTTKNRNELFTVSIFIMLMTLSSYNVFFSSLFGDGFIEFARHNHLYFSILITLISTYICVGLIIAAHNGIVTDPQ